MRAYISYFKIRFAANLQYRSAAVSGVIVQFFYGFVYLMLFKAFYDSGGYSQPISFPDLVSYIWLGQALLALIFLWYRDADITDLITSGNVAYELCRPVNLYFFWFSRLYATRLSRTLLRSIPIIIIAVFLPEPYNLSAPASLASFLGFLLCMFLGSLVLVAVSMFVYIFTFVTLSYSGPLVVLSSMQEFLSGSIIPLPLMPPALQRIAYFFPFAYSFDAPFRLYSGNIPLTELPVIVSSELLWLAVLVVLGLYSMNLVLRRTVIQGG